MDGSEAPITFPFAEAPAEGEVREVAPGVLWTRLPLPMKLDHVNVFALDDGDGWTIVDTGFDTGRARAIWEALLGGPLSGKPVRRVIVTHHHPDHVGLAGWFQSVRGTGTWATRTAWLMARMLVLDEQETYTAEQIGFYRSAGMPDDLMKERLAARPFNFADVVAPMPLGFHRLREGDSIRAGGRNWDVRIGHGHAPEHATLWSADDGLLLAGDQILPGISPNLGVYPTEPEADPVGEWLDSCNRFLACAQPGRLVLPGHKLPFTGLRERLLQLIDNHRSALRRLEDFLDTPRTAGECFLTLFKREIGPDEYGLALVESVAHLNHLRRSGSVVRERGDGGAWLWRRVAGG
ncbi:MAG: MBL fold metallo-hydrolase [Paracoccaceae bacterium]